MNNEVYFHPDAEYHEWQEGRIRDVLAEAPFDIVVTHLNERELDEDPGMLPSMEVMHFNPKLLYSRLTPLIAGGEEAKYLLRMNVPYEAKEEWHHTRVTAKDFTLDYWDDPERGENEEEAKVSIHSIQGFMGKYKHTYNFHLEIPRGKLEIPGVVKVPARKIVAPNVDFLGLSAFF